MTPSRRSKTAVEGEPAAPANTIPLGHHWVFWDVEVEALDTTVAADYIIPRILEFGGIAEVRWLLKTYGLESIHRFLRDVGHPELSKPTLAFWRAVLKAPDEVWATPPTWRTSRAAPWID